MQDQVSKLGGVGHLSQALATSAWTSNKCKIGCCATHRIDQLIAVFPRLLPLIEPLGGNTLSKLDV